MMGGGKWVEVEEGGEKMIPENGAGIWSMD